MRSASVLLAMAGCHPVNNPDMASLNRSDAETLVIVTTEVAEIIALEQPTGGDHETPIEIRIDKDFTCLSGGSGHLSGSGQYTPVPGKGFGPTTFDLTVLLVDCAFDSGTLSSLALTARGPIEVGAATTNLTYQGEVSWPPNSDSCEVTLKLFGVSFEDFDGTACAVRLTPDTLDQLP